MDPQAGKASGQSGSVMGLLGACALLGAALLPFAVAVAWFGYGRSGSVGLAAAAIAGLVCWLSGSLALASAVVGQRLGTGIQGFLAGMLFRMGLPLGTGILLHQNHAPLAQAGVLFMILGLYLVALVVETLLSLRFVQRSAPAPRPVEVAGPVQLR